MLTRRTFLQTSLQASAALAASPAAPPKRIAILATVYRLNWPAQLMGDRFLVGYPYGGAWRTPNVRVVSLYVDQTPEGDLSAARAREFGFQVYPTIPEALRCGGQQLAIDAVLLVDQPGRSEFFTQCVKVFDQDRRAVPVYHHERLSHSFEKAQAMLDASRRLNFPMLAGSSIPVTWRLPSIDLPLDCVIEDALMVVGGRGDAMDFHSLEGLQSMVERRRGGETGVQAVQLLEGDAVWKAGETGRYSKELLTAALSRSDTPLGLTMIDGRTQDLVASNELPKLVQSPAAYFIEYRDGLKAAVLLLDGAIKDFNFAARLQGSKQIWSTQFLLTPEPNVTHSACLMHKAAQMFETGVTPYPVERTLLTGGILESCLRSKLQNQARLETPHLRVVYQAPRASQFQQI
jgi:hypothetical protein